MNPDISTTFEQKINLTKDVFNVHVAADKEGVFFTPLTENSNSIDATWEEIYTILRHKETANAIFALTSEIDRLNAINLRLIKAVQTALEHLEGLGDYYKNANPNTIPLLKQSLTRTGE